MATSPPTLLVIGGGPVALTAIASLRKLGDSDVRIVMVEPKDYCEIVWATFRTPFDAALADDMILPLEPWCAAQQVEHVRSKVKKVSETEATLENGDVIHFTVALLATGASCPWSGLGRGPQSWTKPERMEHLQLEGEKLLSSDSVCIVGGGLIGVELAGDLADYASSQGKQVTVTLVHNGPHLCHINCSHGCGEMLQRKLEDLGVKVVLNEKAEKLEDGNVRLLHSGDTLNANKVVMTVGVQSVSKSLVDSKYLDAKGFIIVDKTFRVKQSSTLMSAGDCCNYLMNAANQIFMNRAKLAWNIKQVLDENTPGKTPKPLKEVAPAPS